MSSSKTHKKCSVTCCNNKTSPETTLFNLPESEDIKKLWLDALGIQNRTKKIYVCIKHFPPENLGKCLLNKI